MYILESELTPTEIYNILALFGFQNQTHKFKNARVSSPLDALLLNPPKSNHKAARAPQDFLEGYRCEGEGT